MELDAALLIVDVQNDFLPGGALAVPQGNQVIPVILELIPRFKHVLATQDWHPQNHCSFKKWPAHCIQGTSGANIFASLLNTRRIEAIFQKGIRPDVEAYSPFFDELGSNATNLDRYLFDHSIDHLYICGLATEYCVAATAHDASELRYDVRVIKDACRGIDEKACEKTFLTLAGRGIQMLNSNNLY